MAGNSNYILQQIVDDAQSLGDTAPALATGGFSDKPALSIADDVMTAMLLGGPAGQPFNWKWNRFNVMSFPTISWQQDYFIPGLWNLGWLEYCWAVDINSTATPKRKIDIEIHRDLEVTDAQTGFPAKICWIPCNQAQTGVWGQTQLQNVSGLSNPGPGVVYTNPVGAVNQPTNPTNIITDPNGNLWLLTTYGTCGSVQPTWPTNPLYPTQATPEQVATTVNDGTCVWTAINPNGQAMRLNPIPPQTGTVWQIHPVGQKRVPRFISLGQSLDPIPDDYVSYFKQGFFAQCYRRSPDAKVRAKFKDEWTMWLDALDKAVKQGSREMDDIGFYPGGGVMDTGWSYQPNPAMPYGPYR